MKNTYIRIFLLLILFSFCLSCEYFVKMNEVEFTDINTGNSSFLFLNSAPINNVKSVICSPDGKHVYACDDAVNQISKFERNLSTGNLILKGVQGMGEIAVISSSGEYVYAPHGNDIEVFRRDFNNGDLTSIQTYALGDILNDIKISANSKYLYAVSTGIIYTINLDNTNGRIISQTNQATTANSICLEISNSGEHVYVGGGDVFKYNRNISTGDLTYDGQINLGSNITSLRISNDDKFLYADRMDVYKINRNLSNGDLTSFEFFLSFGNAGYLDISKDNNYLYKAEASAAGNTVYFMLRDTDTGKLQSFTQYTGSLNNYRGIAVSCDDKNIYASAQDSSELAIFRRE